MSPASLKLEGLLVVLSSNKFTMAMVYILQQKAPLPCKNIRDEADRVKAVTP